MIFNGSELKGGGVEGTQESPALITGCSEDTFKASVSMVFRSF